MSSQMETLSDKFNSLLTQYQTTYQDFINTVSSNDNSFTFVNNSAFIANILKTIQSTTAEKCMTSCENNKSCTGATFNSEQNLCMLNSGTGNIIKSQNQIAIVKQALYYSYQLQQINKELIDVNTKMMQIANGYTSIYDETQQVVDAKKSLLQQNYNTLEHERAQIFELVREYETLNSAYDTGSISVNANYYRYIMYLLIVVVLIIVLIKTSFISNETQMGGGNNHGMQFSPFLFVLLFAIIIFNASIK